MAERRKKRVGFLPKLILTVFIIYSVWTLVSLQIQIHKQKAVVESLTEQVEAERTKNAELTQQAEAEPDDEYITQEARKQGLETPDTRVFVDVSGN